MIRKILILLFLYIPILNAEPLLNCEWDNRKGTPCVTIATRAKYNQVRAVLLFFNYTFVPQSFVSA